MAFWIDKCACAVYAHLECGCISQIFLMLVFSDKDIPSCPCIQKEPLHGKNWKQSKISFYRRRRINICSTTRSGDIVTMLQKKREADDNPTDAHGEYIGDVYGTNIIGASLANVLETRVTNLMHIRQAKLPHIHQAKLPHIRLARF